jgi:EAL domain-containing protein (putative c-di-GMP-specific phosphodiesterase class I)
VQGFLFAEPMSAGDVDKLFREDKVALVQNVA